MPEVGDLLRLFFCMNCMDTHGSFPQSVSCYCHCHEGVDSEERWPSVRADVLTALGPETKSERRNREDIEEGFR